MDAYTKLLAETKLEFPKFELVVKSESRLMKAIDVFLRAITLNMQKGFLSRYVTTIGTTVYIPSSWFGLPWQNRASILRHERVHMHQAKGWRRVFFSFAYLFLPVPCIAAWCRKRYEQDAYEETMRADLEYQGKEVFTDQYEEWLISQFTGPAYFWTWPWKSSIRSWYRATKALLVEGLI